MRAHNNNGSLSTHVVPIYSTRPARTHTAHTHTRGTAPHTYFLNEGIHLDLDTWIVPGQIRKIHIFCLRKIIISFTERFINDTG